MRLAEPAYREFPDVTGHELRCSGRPRVAQERGDAVGPGRGLLLANNPNVGPEPVDAKPNHVREKTYKAPNLPEPIEAEVEALPEKTAETKVETDMKGAVDAVRDKL